MSSSKSSSIIDLTQSRIETYMSQLRKNFECTICIDYFNKPVITNCQHVFCKNCIENYIGSKRSQGCPLCKSVVNLRSLREFTVLDEYVEKTKKLAVAFEKDRKLAKTKEESQKAGSPESVKSPLVAKAARISHVQSPAPSKRKRITSVETAASKKKKSNENLEDNKSTAKIPDSSEIRVNDTLPEENVFLCENISDTTGERKKGTLTDISNREVASPPICMGRSTITITKIGEKKDPENSAGPLDETKKHIDKMSSLIHVTDQSDSDKNSIVSMADMNSGNEKRNDSPAVHAPNQPKTDDPLKFRKEKSDVSDHQSVALHRAKTDHITPAPEPVNCANNLTKSCGDAEIFKQARARIADTPARSSSSGPENKTNETPRKDRVDETILFEDHRVNYEETGQVESPETFKTKQMVDSSTNTARLETREIGVQVNSLEIYLNTDLDSLVDTISARIYYNWEKEVINSYMDEFFRSIPVVVPESPPIQHQATPRNNQAPNKSINVQDRGITPEDQLDTSVSSRPKKTAKRDLLNTSSVFSLNTSGYHHRRKPSLEFVNSQSTTSANKASNRRSNEEVAEIQTGIRSTSKTTPNKDVIHGTPVKTVSNRMNGNLQGSGRKSEDIIELEERLSKSANRIEISVSSRKLLENSMLVEEKRPEIKNEPTRPTQPTILLAQDEPTVILTGEAETHEASQPTMQLPSKPPDLMPPPRQKAGESFNVIDSLDTSGFPNHLGTNLSVLQSSSRYAAGLPPPAADILGSSLIHSTGMALTINTNLTLSTPSASSATNLSNIVVTKQEKIDHTDESNKSGGKDKDKETQLLTDSAMMAIDNFCNNRSVVANSPSPYLTINSANASSSMPTRIEFVSSLLKPDMKNILRKYAARINATIANDVTSTTTHLIVESDQDLLCGVTSKYLKAIVRKIWIVSSLWILNNLNSSKFINPELFEIKGDTVLKQHNGPRNSRLSQKKLFENFEFLFVSHFNEDTISLATIMELATMSGASIKTSADELTPGNPNKLIIFDESVQKISTIKAARIKEQSGIVCVNKCWLLDSLASFKIYDTKSYETYS